MNIFKVFKRIGNKKMEFSRQKIVMRMYVYKNGCTDIIFGPECDIGRYVIITSDEINNKKVNYWHSLREKYETIIRRMKYNV